MKQIYASLIALLLVMSCNNIKTDSTLQQLTFKTENLNTLKKASLKNDISILENTSKLDDTFKNKFDLVLQVSSIADDYFNYLDAVKNHVKTFKANTGKEKTINSLQKEYFSSKKLTKQGLQFLDSLASFKRKVLFALNKDFPETQTLIDSLFSIKPVKVLNNKEEPWLAYQFKSVSNVGALANLTLLQSDIVTIEKHLLSTIMGDEQVNANAYRVDVVLDKSKYYPGEKINGKLFISKSSENLVPNDVIVNGNNIPKNNYKDGEVAISFRAAKQVGTHPVDGEMSIKQGNLDVVLYFNKSYKVVAKAKPRARVKKNEEVAGNDTKNDKKVLSNKDIGVLPKPLISIRGIEADGRGIIKIKKASFRLATIDVIFPNSDYEAVVTEFYFKPSNQPAIKIYGNKLTTRAISILNKSKRGRKFVIFKVKSKLKIKPSYRVKMPDTVNIELIN